MFWDSVVQGIGAFSHWEVLIVIGTYAVVMFAVVMTGGVLITKERVLLGMGWMMLVAPAVQIVATLVAVMTLAPIIFSLGDSASWELPWVLFAERTWRIIKVVGVAFLFLVVLGASGLGRIPAVSQFATGAIATSSTASLMAGISPNLRASDLELWPGLFVVVGFIVIAAILQFVVVAALSFAASLMKVDVDENQGAFTLLVMPLSAAFMFLPTFMYAAYLAPQLAAF